jgi:hypothetical protein
MNAVLVLTDVSKIDPIAYTLVLVGLVVVFLALTLLVIIFNNVPRIGDYLLKLKGKFRKSVIIENKSKQIPAQVTAAISAAIYLYLDDIHDKETRVMTIRRVSKTYSPWSSKIYGLNILRK